MPTRSSTDRIIELLQTRLLAQPEDGASHTQLGNAYLQKARESGDPTYYTKAEEALQKALAIDPQDYGAMAALGSLSLARHQFSDALEWGERARESGHGSAYVHGVLGDALIELGQYEEAVAAFQEMVNLRPDLSSYARVSYARELMGDPQGAIEAMRWAVEASGPKGENAAWARVQLANLYFNTGDIAAAEAEYQRSLQAYPDYIHALAGLGKVSAAQADYESAISFYSRVVDRYPVPEYVSALGDVYRAAGIVEKANRQYELVEVIDQLYRTNGVNTDLELALYFIDHDLRLDEALRQARAEYERRPGIQAADVLAWALYKSGLYEEALAYSQEALRLGTQDATMLFHAGMINYRSGDYEEARNYLERAVGINPRFSVLYSEMAAQTLQELQSLVQG